jgi:hypothetical protein
MDRGHGAAAIMLQDCDTAVLARQRRHHALLQKAMVRGARGARVSVTRQGMTWYDLVRTALGAGEAGRPAEARSYSLDVQLVVSVV